MKFFITYLLCLLSLSQSLGMTSTNMYNLKELVKHYNTHKSEFDDNIYQFLDQHFGGEREAHSKKHEHSDHDELPFKECKFHAHNHNLLLPQASLSLNLIIENFKFDINAAYIKHFESLESPRILQPPRIV
ncbi:MAG: hypothetical protein L0J45_00920 [Psychroflexus sp.]|nr:hypothetical protein [Psychroflexus sp.]